jgi:hypothetical protein
MNSEHRFDEDQQREWEAQEIARLSGGNDALSRRYRVVMQSIDAMPRPLLSEDFAARVARRVEAERTEWRVLAPFERVAMIALAFAFVVAILIGAAMANVLPSIGDIVREARGTAAVRWLAVLALCVVLFALPLSRTKRERGALHH